jgi:hypothetical protein
MSWGEQLFAILSDTHDGADNAGVWGRPISIATADPYLDSAASALRSPPAPSSFP